DGGDQQEEGGDADAQPPRQTGPPTDEPQHPSRPPKKRQRLAARYTATAPGGVYGFSPVLGFRRLPPDRRPVNLRRAIQPRRARAALLSRLTWRGTRRPRTPLVRGRSAGTGCTTSSAITPSWAATCRARCGRWPVTSSAGSTRRNEHVPAETAGQVQDAEVL